MKRVSERNDMLRKYYFWLECLKQGVTPNSVDATTAEEVLTLRKRGAQELEQRLTKLLVQRHGQNIGTTSPIARAKILGRVSTDITMKLGRWRGTIYSVRYERHGTWETLRIYKDGLEMSPLGIEVSELSLRNQRNIQRLL